MMEVRETDYMVMPECKECLGMLIVFPDCLCLLYGASLCPATGNRLTKRPANKWIQESGINFYQSL